ncbi:hypothetical protein [Nocardia sp. NPDC051750]|uniref:hypothetical protein n=1 Tax=Nocardia sp. NPDC051750 TaxID=3364325 RepID=UPI00378DAE0C
MFESDLDPKLEAVARRVLNAVGDLETARLRLERTELAELWSEPIPVTEGLLQRMADSPASSPELKAYAMRVAAGECRWCDIERLAMPLPPEVPELKALPAYEWNWGAAPPAPPPPPPPPLPPVQRPRAGREQVVGPSDWPDDLDEYPEGKSWLV